MERLHVFVDEFGDTHLDTSKGGVSSTYIVAAVCVRDRALADVKAAMELIRSKHFQQGEMKSSGVGQNDGRRLQIIRDLAKVDCFVIAFCAQKKNLNRGTGLEFKKSFIKFFASSLYKRIGRCADTLQVLIDEHGSEIFQEELRKYLLAKVSGDLFQTQLLSLVIAKTIRSFRPLTFSPAVSQGFTTTKNCRIGMRK